MLFAAPLAFCVAFICLLVLLSAPVRGLALDRPNERSLHQVPVPRTGGLAIMAGTASSLALLPFGDQLPVLLAIALAAISFADDLRGLSTLLRFALHLGAAAAALMLLFPRPDAVLFVPLLLGIAWLTNLYNFMDGSDGLAGGMAVIGFGAYALAASTAGANWLAIPCAAIAAAAFAFLIFNTHPARIFMGDVGSIPLGFLAGALGIAGWRDSLWPLWFPLLVFSPFAVDASFTLAKRIVRRERLWQAHRDHYYQRLVRMGLGHRNTALAEYVLMGACACAALAVRDAPAASQGAVLAGAALVYVVLATGIDVRWARHTSAGAAR